MKYILKLIYSPFYQASLLSHLLLGYLYVFCNFFSLVGFTLFLLICWKFCLKNKDMLGLLPIFNPITFFLKQEYIMKPYKYDFLF
jgi:hypothetical protein